jgi:hypothetical protein
VDERVQGTHGHQDDIEAVGEVEQVGKSSGRTRILLLGILCGGGVV